MAKTFFFIVSSENSKPRMKRKAPPTVIKPKGAVKKPFLKRQGALTGTALTSAAGMSGLTEKKVYDLSSTTADVNSTGSFKLLCIPTTGSDFNNRVGRKIRIHSFYIRGYMANQNALTAAASTDAAQQGRMIIFVDLQPNGATPAVTDLLVSASPVSHLNLNNRDRFRILADETFVFDPYINVTTATQAQSSTVNQIHDVKRYQRTNIETIFNATNGGTIADITSGALFLLTIGSTVAGNNDGILQFTSRVRYSDV